MAVLPLHTGGPAGESRSPWSLLVSLCTLAATVVSCHWARLMGTAPASSPFCPACSVRRNSVRIQVLAPHPLSLPRAGLVCLPATAACPASWRASI